MDLIQFIQYHDGDDVYLINSDYNLEDCSSCISGYLPLIKSKYPEKDIEHSGFVANSAPAQENQIENRTNKYEMVVGRGQVQIFTIKKGHDGLMQEIILRKCLRGGFFRKILGDKFFNVPFLKRQSESFFKIIFNQLFPSIVFNRPFAEIHILKFLYENGLAVPKPAFALFRVNTKKSFYNGFVATEKINDVENLLEVVHGDYDEKKLSVLAFLLGREAREMLELGVFHSDLHLGNVLVNQEKNTVYLIDFDKAFKFPREELFQYMLKTARRFAKSANKHKVSDYILAPFYEGLGIG